MPDKQPNPKYTLFKKYTPYVLDTKFLGEQRVNLKKIENGVENIREVSFWDALKELLEGEHVSFDDTFTFGSLGIAFLKGSCRYEIGAASYLKDLAKLLIEEPKSSEGTWYFLERTWSRFDTSSSSYWDFFVCYQGEIICEMASLRMDTLEELPSEIFVDSTHPSSEYSSNPPSSEHELAWARTRYRNYYKNSISGQHIAQRKQNEMEISVFGHPLEELDFAPEATQFVWLRSILQELRWIRYLLITLVAFAVVLLLKYFF